jgi:DNA-binding IclR family transcriptional regulator
MLTAMHAGDLTTVEAVVEETGIGPESAAQVLATLVRADLFEQRGHQFIRISVFGGAEML